MKNKNVKHAIFFLGILISTLLVQCHAAEVSEERPTFDYRYADVTYKPYVEKFRTPSGVNILRDTPPDHKHHHGLMLAFTVDGQRRPVFLWGAKRQKRRGPGR